MSSFLGTPEYMAPEVMAVLNANMNSTGRKLYYDFRCDVWSLGVIIYEILTGDEPYSLEDLARFVGEGAALADLRPCNALQGEAFEFVRGCLIPVYQERPSAVQLTSQPFVHAREAPPRSPSRGDAAAQEKLASNLASFMKASAVKKAALTAAARNLAGYELYKLRENFESIDTKRDGVITLDEWRQGFPSVFGEKSAEWIEQAFAALDTDASGEIDYVEFLAGVMDSRLEERRHLAWVAFKAFDHSNSGSICKADLRRVLEEESVRDLLSSRDQVTFRDEVLCAAKPEEDSDELSFDAFLSLLRIS